MLLITIAKGTTPDARQEISDYIKAYSCQTITDTADAITLLTPDTDAAPVFLDMEHNHPAEIITDPETITAAIMAA
jgi:hypothetical protein